MIAQVIRYKTKDGCEWADQEDAKKHERLIDAIDIVMSRMPNLDITGHHFYQHVPAHVMYAQGQIAALAYAALEHDEKDKHHYDSVINATRPMGLYSIIGRFISDRGGPLDRAWGRIMRIDEQFREWEQPYYTTHTPTDAVEIKTK